MQVSQTGDLREVIPKNLTAGPMVVYLGMVQTRNLCHLLVHTL